MSYTINYGGLFDIGGYAEGTHTDQMTVGVMVGWQWFSGDDFTYGLALGMDKYFFFAGGWSKDYISFIPAVRFRLGYSWE
jgi:hypothetical protein